MLPIRYSIKPVNPAAHLFEVQLTVDNPDPDGQVFRLPTWIPGSYMIRDYARHIVSIRAAADGRSVDLEKLDKTSWRAAAVDRPLTVIAEIYAWDESVRGAHLDTNHGFFNGACVFLEAVGHCNTPCTVKIECPDKPYGKGWRVVTSMERGDASLYDFGTYEASCYAELIDHPVEMGELVIGEFEVRQIPHVVALRGRHNVDISRLCHDLERVCASHMDMLPPPVDLDRYVFLINVKGDGYGGLEHAWSSANVISRHCLPVKGEEGVSEDYRNFLGLVSHEYFHLWNVKRMRPAKFWPYDLTEESHTGLLWVFEGITSFYDDLNLLRAGLIGAESYLELVARVMTRVRRGAGRKRQSVEASSFDAWTKFYKQDANAGNAIVSYYAKGALIALALDLKLRIETEGRIALDDVMGECWRRFGETERGLEEREFEAVCNEVSGLRLDDFFEAAVRGTGELPLDALLARHGIEVHYRAAAGQSDKGGKPAEPLSAVGFGAALSEQGGRTQVTAVANDSPAELAGLAAGDELVAIGGLRVTAASLDTVLKRYRVRDRVAVDFFRGDELRHSELVFEPAPADTIWLTLAGDADDTALGFRRQFLGS